MMEFASLTRPADRLPRLRDAALLIDFDGTLVDIAARPDAVIVPADLPATLRALRGALGEALAVVTGRPLEQVDFFLPGVPTAVAGEHGAALRHAPGAAVEREVLPSAPASWLAAAADLAARHEGALLERKERGFVLHYRQAPDAGNALRAGLATLVAGDARFAIQPALMAWEVRPRGVDKGSAVSALMARPPFRDRLPVFIGDDVTDEDGMRVARSLGGAGLRVPDVFGDAAGVRAWLAATVRG